MQYGLYYHIPYCESRCGYCDFYTNAPAGAVPEPYVQALLRCLEARRPRAGGEAIAPATVYFGGGTPSLLSGEQLARLLAAARPAPGAEVTLEANPDSATPEKLAAWRRAGVNRLSLGVQSARDASLAALGRRHSAGDARRALASAAAAGFDNISGDIMLALPGYGRAEFDETLALLAGGGASHISAYLLKLEAGTPMSERPPGGLPGADEAAEFYLYAVEKLAGAGYAQYEISNFARPGREGRHNLFYWDAGEWLGAGAAAHSCLGGRRFSFAADAAAFVAGPPEAIDEGALTISDYIMLRLRLAAGLSEAALAERWGQGLSEAQKGLFTRLAADGKARKTPEGWALTPAGMLVQNAVLAALFF